MSEHLFLETLGIQIKQGLRYLIECSRSYAANFVELALFSFMSDMI
jgi:hypothetical protein